MRTTTASAPRAARLRSLLAAALLTGLLAASSCVTEEQVSEGDNGDPATQRLSIATGGTGGVYFVYGGGLAELITRNLDGVEATAEATSASVDNMLLIADEASDVAFTLADTAQDAVEGREGFDEAVPAQALAQIYTNYTQVVTTANTGIETINDLRGQRVSVGSPNSGTEVIALRIFEAVGMDADTDIDRQQLDVEQSVQALRDGTIDAFFWSGGLPTGAITDLTTTDQVVMIPTGEYADDLQQTYGDVYSETDIPADAYDGLEQDVSTIVVPNYLVVNESMDEELAHDLTELLFDRKDELVQVHPEAENLDPETAQEVIGLELHPGAERYFEESEG
jgi:TRAP transporter TAXI family solute receptor